MTTEQLKALAEATLAGNPDYDYDPDAEKILARGVIDLNAELGKVRADVAVLREAAQDLLNQKFGTFGKGKRQRGIQGNDGEKCWIVHSDQILALEGALTSTTSGTELLAEVARLRANQRTAGTVEICERGPERCDYIYDCQWEDCDNQDCPIRNKKEST